MNALRKYNYYFSEFGFISNDEVTVYKLKNKKILVQDIFDVELVTCKPCFFKTNSLLFSNVFMSFYCLVIVLASVFILKKIKKRKNTLKFKMMNGLVYQISFEDKFKRKAELFRKRILEYKLCLEVESLEENE